ncbi:hypothetical protein [Sodalis sp. RH16]|uniref:hypothetical protein n=1 Tax=Sodalis sp. RH16 TaxID=3394331 RepID=UPI0039B3FFC0
MAHEAHQRHPFLDDLTSDAEMTGTALRRPVYGRENIKKLIETVATLYKSQTPIFLETVGSRSFLQYEAELTNGMPLTGVAVIERNAQGGVHRVSITMSPLGPVLSLSGQLGALLGNDVGEDLFL